MELTIIEQNGWKKSVEIEKAVIRIGSAPGNDVILTSQQLSPVQLQLHYLQDNPSTCKVLNVGGEVVVWQNQSQAVLPPYAMTHISNGSEIILGEYRLQFTLPFAARTVTDSNSIQAMLSFSDATLRSESATTGVLSLKNTGLESACQFEVLLQGFPVDCMQVDPVPLLYPGAQEDVRVQLFHRKLYPAAGAQELVVMVSSPTSYPGEQVVIRQGIYVAPVLEHSVKIFDDMAREEPIEAEQIAEAPITVPVQATVPMMAEQVSSPIGEEIEPLTPVSVPAVQTLPVSNAPVESVSPPSIVVSRPAPPQDIFPENSRPIEPKTPPKVPVQASPPPPPPQQQASEEKAQEEAVQTSSTENDVESTSQAAPKPRVVRSPSDDFWDEE